MSTEILTTVAMMIEFHEPRNTRKRLGRILLSICFLFPRSWLAVAYLSRLYRCGATFVASALISISSRRRRLGRNSSSTTPTPTTTTTTNTTTDTTVSAPVIRHESPLNRKLLLRSVEIMDQDSSVDAAEVVDRRRGSRPRSFSPSRVFFPPSGPNSPIRPPPLEHILPISSSTNSPPASPAKDNTYRHSSPRPLPLQYRRDSVVLEPTPRSTKRLTLQFPIQIPSNTQPIRPSPSISPSLATTSSTPVTFPDPSSSAAAAAIVPSPATGTSFLTALAAQERRVLELKEELHKAERELDRLKKQWASHEATRKRNDMRRVHPLQPVRTTFATATNTNEVQIADGEDDDVDGSSLWLQREMERRKALLNGVRPSQRTVFSGSKHTRTLSLLSPEKGAHQRTASFPVPEESRNPREPTKVTIPSTTGTPDSAAAAAAADDEVAEAYDESNDGSRVVQRDNLLRTGKQMATDFKEGLLTFIEDLRQATVGEEGINATKSRTTQPTTVVPQKDTSGRREGANKANHRASMPPPRRDRGASVASLGKGWVISRTSTTHDEHDLNETNHDQPSSDIGGSFWKDHGLPEPEPATASSKTPRRHSKSVVVKPALPKPVVSDRVSATNNTTTTTTSMTDSEDGGWDTWDSANEKSPTMGFDRMRRHHGTSDSSDSSTAASASASSSGAQGGRRGSSVRTSLRCV